MSKERSLDTAMVLAAGFGTRMRPLTDSTPKPLVPLCGKPLIDWTFDRLRAGQVRRFVVNSHYLPDQIENHFQTKTDVTLSHEAEILETGGGVKKALPLLGASPFFVANADIVWLDGIQPAVNRMRDAFDPDRMDVLLLLHPVATAGGDYAGPGDFHLDPSGIATRRAEQELAPFLFAGLSVLTPDLFDGTPDGPFSLNQIFNKASEAGRLFGIVHDGEWYHVGTPSALAETETVIEHGFTAANTR